MFQLFHQQGLVVAHADHVWYLAHKGALALDGKAPGMWRRRGGSAGGGRGIGQAWAGTGKGPKPESDTDWRL